MKALLSLAILSLLVSCQPSGSSKSSTEGAEVSADYLKGGVRPNRNTAPVVRGGLDITVTDSDKSGREIIQLAGSATDAENNIVTYNLYQNGSLLLTGGSSDIFLVTRSVSVGTHEFRMEAIDARGLTGSDSVKVTVNPFAGVTNTAPSVNAGLDIVRTDSDNNGSEIIALAGSATDAQNNIASYRVLLNGAQIATSLSASITVPVGVHTVTMEATDSAGLKGSDTLMITVNKGNTAPLVNAGLDISRTDSDNNGSELIALAGSASDVDNNIVSYRVLLNGAQVATSLTASISVPVGTHTGRYR